MIQKQIQSIQQSRPRELVVWFSLSQDECERGSAEWVKTYLRDKAEKAVQEALERAGARGWLDE